MNKRVMLVLLLVAVLAIMTGCNKQILDTTHYFDYAVICFPDGGIVEGTVQSWKDFTDGDQIQVKIDGTTYLTHISNVVMMSGGGMYADD